MVTTRSAEKRLSLEGKTEDLALRSRKLDIGASPSPTPSSTTSRKRTKISIDVPSLPEKKQKLHSDVEDTVEDESNYSTAKESPDSFKMASSQSKADPLTSNEKSLVTKAEIPESQSFQASVDSLTDARSFVSLDNSDQTITATFTDINNKGEKVAGLRTISRNTAATTSITTPDNTGSHLRLGSEELVGTEGSVATPARQSAGNEGDDSEISEEDGAPKVASIRRTGRQTRSQQYNKRKKLQRTDDNTTIANQSQPILHEDNEQPTKSQAQQPTLFHESLLSSSSRLFPIEASNPPILQPFSFSFSTPTQDQPILNLTRHLQSLQFPPQKEPRIPINPSKNLPPKSTNSFEKYRRRNLMDRMMVKRNGNGNGRERMKMKMQEEWNMKRRKFIVS